MQFESDFRFDMDDNFSMCSQPISCPSAGTSFSSASSAYDPFTPSSRRSTPNELIDFADGSCSYPGQQQLQLTPPSITSKYMFGPVKQEPEQVSFAESLPSTPMKKMEGFEYEQLLDMNLASHPSIGTVTPSHSFGMNTISPEAAMGQPTSYMMTPTHSSMSGSDAADTASWPVAHESPITFLQNKDMGFNDIHSMEIERHSHSPMNHYNLQSQHHHHSSPHRYRVQRKLMLHEVQRKTSELQKAQIRASRKRTEKVESGPVDVVRRAMCKCDYPGCHKAFRRNEHLKRHKQTFHGEGPNRFSCEFCGKDQFNRQDNLNNHRKLHARPNSRNRGVEFIPAAVSIIEQEERSRKRRAPPKSKLGGEKRPYAC